MPDPRRSPARARIDYRNPLTNHELNFGRVAWWNALPGRLGGSVWWDLVAAHQGTLTSFGTTTGWRTNIRTGEYSSLLGTAASNCYVNFPTTAGMRPALSFSVALTLKTTTASNQVVFECNGNSGFTVQVNAHTVNRASCWTGAGASGVETSINVNDGKPHRLLFVLSLNSGIVYVDGVNRSSLVGTGCASPTYASAPFYAFSRAGSFGFDGSINDLTVWTRPLSPAEALTDATLSEQGYPGVLRRREPAAWFVGTTGGGTTWTRSVSDNLAGQDGGVARQAASFRLLTDNLALTDAAARQSAAFRVVLDNLAFTDTASRQSAAFRAATDNLALTDSLSRQSAAFRLATDNLGASDTVSRLVAALRQFSDNLGITDLTTVHKFTPGSLTILIADSLGVTDVLIRQVASLRKVSDNAGLSDTTQRLVASLRAVADNLGASDTLIRSAGWGRLVNDNLGATDALTRSAACLRLLADTLGATDAASRQLTANRLVVDNLGATDSAQRIVTALRLLSDQLGVADTAQIAIAVIVFRKITLMGTYLPNRNLTGN